MCYLYYMTMRGDNNRPLKEWLQVFVQSPQLRDKLFQKRIESVWAERMGPTIKGYTRRIKLDGRVLLLFIESASLKNELNIMKEDIRRIINEQLGEEYVSEVKIL